VCGHPSIPCDPATEAVLVGSPSNRD
jgi:hypothetical protein